MSDTFHKSIIEEIIMSASNKLSRPMTKQEINFSIESLLKMKQSQYINYDADLVISTISDILADQIRKRKTKPELAKNEIINNQATKSKANARLDTGDVDIHQFLVKEVNNNPDVSSGQYKPPANVVEDAIETKINIDKFFGASSTKELQLMLNPSSRYEKNYLLLDSWYANEILSNNTRFQWNYASTANIANGFVNTVGEIRNIVSIKLMQPILPVTIRSRTSNNIVFLNNFESISILIEEFSAQAFLANATRKYHFLVRPFYNLIDDRMLECQVEGFGDGVYNFNKPITTFDTLTISFGNPLSVVPIITTSTATVVAYNNGSIDIEVKNRPFEPAFTDPIVGTVIYVSGFTTADPGADAIAIEQVNSPNGLLVNYYLSQIPLIYRLEVDYDMTLVDQDPNLVINLRFAMTRFVLPFEFTSLKL